MQFDAIHVLGYAGALGSLFVGGGQLVEILRSKKADGVSALDYIVRAVASVMLGIYSTSMMDVVFLIVNFGSGLLSLAVLGAAWWVKRHPAPEPQTERAASEQTGLDPRRHPDHA